MNLCTQCACQALPRLHMRGAQLHLYKLLPVEVTCCGFVHGKLRTDAPGWWGAE